MSHFISNNNISRLITLDVLKCISFPEDGSEPNLNCIRHYTTHQLSFQFANDRGVLSDANSFALLLIAQAYGKLIDSIAIYTTIIQNAESVAVRGAASFLCRAYLLSTGKSRLMEIDDDDGGGTDEMRHCIYHLKNGRTGGIRTYGSKELVHWCRIAVVTAQITALEFHRDCSLGLEDLNYQERQVASLSAVPKDKEHNALYLIPDIQLAQAVYYCNHGHHREGILQLQQRRQHLMVPSYARNVHRTINKRLSVHIIIKHMMKELDAFHYNDYMLPVKQTTTAVSERLVNEHKYQTIINVAYQLELAQQQQQSHLSTQFVIATIISLVDHAMFATSHSALPRVLYWPVKRLVFQDHPHVFTHADLLPGTSPILIRIYISFLRLAMQLDDIHGVLRVFEILLPRLRRLNHIEAFVEVINCYIGFLAKVVLSFDKRTMRVAHGELIRVASLQELLLHRVSPSSSSSSSSSSSDNKKSKGKYQDNEDSFVRLRQIKAQITKLVARDDLETTTLFRPPPITDVCDNCNSTQSSNVAPITWSHCILCHNAWLCSDACKLQHDNKCTSSAKNMKNILRYTHLFPNMLLYFPVALLFTHHQEEVNNID